MKRIIKGIVFFSSIGAITSMILNNETNCIKATNATVLSPEEIKKKLDSNQYLYIGTFYAGDEIYHISEKVSSAVFTGEKEYLGLTISGDPEVDINVTISRTDSFGTSVSVGGGVTIGCETGVKIWEAGFQNGFETQVDISSVIEKMNSFTRTKTYTVPKGSNEWHLYNLKYKADYLVYKMSGFEIIKGYETYNQDGIELTLDFLTEQPKVKKIAFLSC